MSDAIPPASDAKSHLRLLMQRKEELEALLEAGQSQANNGEKLVDEEGFPRSDLDVHTIRNARAEVARLQTDHQALMKQIETAMYALHAEAKAAKLAANPNAQVTAPRNANAAPQHPLQGEALEAQLRADAARAEARAAEHARRAGTAVIAAPAPTPVDRPILHPFYRVASVSADSPAQVAGLLVDDMILQFGSVTRANVSPAAMSAVVSSSIGRAIPVIVRREGVNKELRLIPQSWGGRGMLGCHLVEL